MRREWAPCVQICFCECKCVRRVCVCVYARTQPCMSVRACVHDHVSWCRCVCYGTLNFFFGKLCLILRNRFVVRFVSNLQGRLLVPSSNPNLFSGVVIFRVRTEFRFFLVLVFLIQVFFSSFPRNFSCSTLFSQILFDYNASVYQKGENVYWLTSKEPNVAEQRNMEVLGVNLQSFKGARKDCSFTVM